MHLFGDDKGPHLAHFQAHRGHDRVELDWEVRNAVGLRWRVLRSKRDFATVPKALPGNGQTLIMEGTATLAASLPCGVGLRVRSDGGPPSEKQGRGGVARAERDAGGQASWLMMVGRLVAWPASAARSPASILSAKPKRRT